MRDDAALSRRGVRFAPSWRALCGAVLPCHQLKFDAKSWRVDAELVVAQWQKGRPVTIFSP